MPSSLFASININLKALRLLAIVLLTPLSFYAQELTGLWIGTLSNDSNTIRKDQSFEVALTEYRGKVYGYSRSEFIVKDTLYYVVKRVKGTIIGDMCEVKDDEIIAFNFPTKLDKGIKVVSTFFRNKIDSTWYLAGKWKTTKTKNYYSVSGSVDLQGETDLTRSKIFPHLEELKLTKDVAFYEESKKGPENIAKIRQVIADKKTTPIIIIDLQTTTSITASLPKDVQPQIVQTTTTITKIIPANTETEKTGSFSIVKNNADDIVPEIKDEAKKTKAIKPEQQTTINKPAITIAKPANTENENVGSLPVAKNNSDDIVPEIKDEAKKIIAIKTEQQTTINKPVITIAKPANTENENVGSLPVAKNDFGDLLPEIKPEQKKIEVSTVPLTSKSRSAEIKKPEANNVKNNSPEKVASANQKEETEEDVYIPITRTRKKHQLDPNSAAALVDERKSEFSQEVVFKSDSLVIALYDNGQIDGDTVSVLLNGEVILAKECLKASAIKKTIYIPDDQSEPLELVLYAENLGKYPPNTGLMIVHDGDDVYQVRFSADLQKNAGVIFRKKKN